MKSFFVFATLILSFNSFAKDFEILKTEKCKSRAIHKAMEEYKKRTGVSLVDARAKEKSALREDTLYHFVDVIEYDTGRSLQVTVGVNPTTCAVKVIN